MSPVLVYAAAAGVSFADFRISFVLLAAVPIFFIIPMPFISRTLFLEIVEKSAQFSRFALCGELIRTLLKASDRPEWPAIPAMCESGLGTLSPGIMITD
jgi:hypothetical protein